MLPLYDKVCRKEIIGQKRKVSTGFSHGEKNAFQKRSDFSCKLCMTWFVHLVSCEAMLYDNMSLLVNTKHAKLCFKSIVFECHQHLQNHFRIVFWRYNQTCNDLSFLWNLILCKLNNFWLRYGIFTEKCKICCLCKFGSGHSITLKCNNWLKMISIILNIHWNVLVT